MSHRLTRAGGGSELLGRDGPTPQTFTIKQWFAPDLGRASGRASMVP